MLAEVEKSHRADGELFSNPDLCCLIYDVGMMGPPFMPLTAVRTKGEYTMSWESHVRVLFPLHLPGHTLSDCRYLV